jgi:predicted unusual protein kinase regulating ubiquinone biosynthesis (AarF/ABC1/UbiB family)
MDKSRFRQVRRFFTRLLLAQLWWELVLPKVGLGRLAARGRSERLRRAAASFRGLAVRLGGVLIKVGQFLSARLDVLPRELTRELAGLQDEVGAEPFEEIRGVIEAEFGVPLGERFLELNPVPIASASIGQAHAARLCESGPDGRPCPEVVVKVQRPHIQEIVEADLAALRLVGAWLQRLKSVRRHVNVPGLLEEFSRTLYEEMDYLNEGKNAERFAAAFKERPEVLVPEVIWSHTTRRVLTLQDVGAIKITDYEGIEAAGISRAEVARRLLDTYLQQIFEDGFFHADPHPGNLFVAPVLAPEQATLAAEGQVPEGQQLGPGAQAAAPASGGPAPDARHPGAWRLVFVDFGMAGTISGETFDALREGLVAVGTRDAARLVETFRRLGLLLPGADLPVLERVTQRVFEVLWGKSTTEMMAMSSEDMARFSDEFGDLLYEMPFQVPENLILLGRCVSILSGMATGLDPEFRVWDLIAPYARKLVEKQAGGGARFALQEALKIGQVLLALPRRLDSVLTRVEEGRLEVQLPQFKTYVSRLERAAAKLAASVAFAAVAVTGTMVYLGGHARVSLGFGAVALGVLLWLLLSR